jgi:hypothetical protein
MPRVRARSLFAGKGLTGAERASRMDAAATLEQYEGQRPRKRADCMPGGANAQRPCPWVGCKFHLAVDVNDVGSVKLNFPHLELSELRDTCALDVADRGAATIEAIGERMNLGVDRIRQIEQRLVRARLLRRIPRSLGLTPGEILEGLEAKRARGPA